MIFPIQLSNWHDEFLTTFIKPIIISDTEEKMKVKHEVYIQEIVDGLGDPCLVVRIASRNTSPEPGQASSGRAYDVFCETTSGRVLFITGRLFKDGNFLIYTTIPEWKMDEVALDYYHNSDDKRNVTISVRVTNSDEFFLDRKAKELGLTRSDIVRLLVRKAKDTGKVI